MPEQAEELVGHRLNNTWRSFAGLAGVFVQQLVDA